MFEAPRAATRSGLRVARTSLFLLETLGWVRERHRFPTTEITSDLPRRARDMQWIAENICAMHGVSVDVSGPVPQEPCLLAANHLGYLDPLAIATTLPCVAIAKQEVSQWPIFGEAMLRLGNLFVTRGCAHSGARVLLRSRHSLARGVSVLTFPEGTTSVGDEVLPLQRGIFALAKIANVPVVPVAVRHCPRESAWVGDQNFVPHYLRTAARTTTRVELRFDVPLDPSAAKTAEGLANLARVRLRARLRDLRVVS
ncbi:MAG: lysophospholipid acyltransferase family protein [Myxococcota bacterium]